jgi:hypothetical protein
MRTTPLLLLAALAGLASHNALAFTPAPTPAPDAPIPVRIAGHIYINVRTGERVVTAEGINRMGPGLFMNGDYWNNGVWFWGIDNPTVNFPTTVGGGIRIGAEASDWGDLAFDTIIDGYTTGYGSLVPGGRTIPGYTLINWWFDCDNGYGDTAAVPVRGIGVASIAGTDPTLHPDHWVGWIYTIDLAGSGEEFELGDTDGSYVGATGLSSTGCDKDDTDGNPLNDSSWSYIFDQSGTGLPLYTCGPMLVLPQYVSLHEDDTSTTTGSTALNTFGVVDALDLYKIPSGLLREQYAGTYNFGGWIPGGGPPYASFWMELFGTLGGGINPCPPADHNNDGSIDILDFLDFIDDFSACDGLPAPCGTYGEADINGDGLVDILDFLDFFNAFSQCS